MRYPKHGSSFSKVATDSHPPEDRGKTGRGKDLAGQLSGTSVMTFKNGMIFVSPRKLRLNESTAK
jgi:hypothetical protein